MYSFYIPTKKHFFTLSYNIDLHFLSEKPIFICFYHILKSIYVSQYTLFNIWLHLEDSPRSLTDGSTNYNWQHCN